MHDVDLTAWVSAAPSPSMTRFREAVHTVIVAISMTEQLADVTFMKGGILLALRYNSARNTTDIDFSTHLGYTPELVARMLLQIAEGLTIASNALGYSTTCSLQSHTIEPRRDPSRATWANLKMKIGYAERGSKEHKRLRLGHSPSTLDIDYSFKEQVPSSEQLSVFGEYTLHVYGLSTIVAEKYRAIIQQPIRDRVRRQDAYDLNFLLDGRDSWKEDMRQEIYDVLVLKAADRNVPIASSSLRDPEVRRRSEQEYTTLAAELAEGTLPDFAETYERVCLAFEGLPWPLHSPCDNVREPSKVATMREFLKKIVDDNGLSSQRDTDPNFALQLQHYEDAKAKGWIVDAGTPHKSSEDGSGIDLIIVKALTPSGLAELQRLSA